MKKVISYKISKELYDMVRAKGAFHLILDRAITLLKSGALQLVLPQKRNRHIVNHKNLNCYLKEDDIQFLNNLKESANSSLVLLLDCLLKEYLILENK